MKRLTVIFLILGGVLIGLAIGFLLGWRQAAFELALQENKVATANLKFYGTNLTPQLREYLKARVYCNVYTFYPSTPGYLLQKDWDYGKVDRDTLGHILVFKDPNQVVWDWESAITNK
jgi:hypothetical protein